MQNAQLENDELSLDRLARHTLRKARIAALGTLDLKTGAPVVTQLAIACTAEGDPILLLSELAAHTRNLMADNRISLLLGGDARSDRLMDRVRLTVQATVSPAAPEDVAALKARYVARHPDTATYDTELNFQYYVAKISTGRLVRGFGATRNLSREALLITAPEALISAESGILAHMNSDHQDAIENYATHLCGIAPTAVSAPDTGPETAPDTGSAFTGWRLTGIDAEGADLGSINHGARIEFGATVNDAVSAREVLVALAKEARQKNS